MDTRAAAVMSVCFSQMPSTPRRMYPFRFFAKKQNTRYRLGVMLHQADISLVRTRYRENIAICDGDIRRDRHNKLALNDQYSDISEFSITLK